jgi:hypothetical protein
MAILKCQILPVQEQGQLHTWFKLLLLKIVLLLHQRKCFKICADFVITSLFKYGFSYKM